MMSPGIFIEDFERTEHSDAFHAVLGRALIIATRFDAMCSALSQSLELKSVLPAIPMSDPAYEELTEKIVSKSATLYQSIESLEVKGVSVILHDARRARNRIVHELGRGLERNLDTLIDGSQFLRQISEEIMDLAYGDYLISYLISEFNGDPIPNKQSMASYVNKIVNWTVELKQPGMT